MKKALCLLVVVGGAGVLWAQQNIPLRTLGGNRPLRNSTAAPAAANPTRPTGSGSPEVGGRSIEFNGATIDLVLKIYGDLTGKTVLRDPQVPQTTAITLQPKQGQELSDEDKILAIETVLEMNGVHLEPYGEKFVRALPRDKVRKDGIPLFMDPDTELNEHSMRVVSVMLTFQNIALDEAQKALEGLKSDKGVLNVYERTGSILVTDTEMIIARMREIAKSIDVQTPVTENVFVRQINNANATEIKTALEAIVQESQKELEKQGKQANQVQQNNRFQPFQPRNLLNRNQPQPAQPTVNASLVTSVSDADRGMIRGKVLILADERSNKLIVVTNKANMDFFDKVIEQLDVETTPDTIVKVYRLKYAEAEDVSDMINDLIGNAASSKNASKGNQNQNARNSTGANMTRGTVQTTKSANQRSGEAKTGELSKENTTVLADKRINGLVVMTNKELVPVLEQIIEAMDVKLAQVLIETCIIEVNLEDSIKTGIDWVHQVGDSQISSAISGGGGSTTLSGKLSDIAVNGVSAGTGLPVGSGLNYYIFNDKFNLSAVIEAAKSDSHSKYLASPVVMTVDNKEATIEATQMRYLLTGFTSSGTSYSTIAVPNYEQKQIGITIKTTPKINPNGTVMLEIEEEYSQLGAPQQIQTSGGLGSTGGDDLGGNEQKGGLITVDVDTTVTRKMSADISLENRQTVILGGLTETKTSQVETGIPILKDIPWIGRYLFGKTEDVETRKELLVFMTPYVLNDAEAAQAEAARRKGALSMDRAWEDNGWSASKLADPVSTKEKLRRETLKWEKDDEEYDAQKKLNEARQERAQELLSRALAEPQSETVAPAPAEVETAEAAPVETPALVPAETPAPQEAGPSLLDELNEEAK